MTPLAKVRHQILKLLGGLGGQTNKLLLDDTGIEPSKAVAWDSENHLTFAVPFQDMKPSIYLGMITLPLYKCMCMSMESNIGSLLSCQEYITVI